LRVLQAAFIACPWHAPTSSAPTHPTPHPSPNSHAHFAHTHTHPAHMHPVPCGIHSRSWIQLAGTVSLPSLPLGKPAPGPGRGGGGRQREGGPGAKGPPPGRVRPAAGGSSSNTSTNGSGTSGSGSGDAEARVTRASSDAPKAAVAGLDASSLPARKAPAGELGLPPQTPWVPSRTNRLCSSWYPPPTHTHIHAHIGTSEGPPPAGFHGAVHAAHATSRACLDVLRPRVAFKLPCWGSTAALHASLACHDGVVTMLCVPLPRRRPRWSFTVSGVGRRP
jgi:hypothetical protein